MKKQYIYLLVLLVFIATAGFVVLKYQHQRSAEKKAAYVLLPRIGTTANNAEWIAAKKNTDNLIAKLRKNPADNKSAIALANAYIIESRISGNISYYDKAAMKIVEGVLENDPENIEGLMLKSLLQLSEHHFSDGLATAQQAVSINPNNSFVYGLLVDANVEMGYYDSAVAAADKMITARPDLRSYSRIAYLREINGDYTGASEAMQRAVNSGTPSQEATEWCRVQLGKLYESMGEKDKATYQYQLSLAARPDYANALAGLGRIAADDNKSDSAIYFFEKAAALSGDLGIKGSLATAYYAAGKKDKAKSLNESVINEMNKNATASAADPTIGHYSDKELAYAYLQANDNDKALEHALAEYNRRPKNIDVNETMAWVYYKRKEFDKAVPYMNAAMVTKNRSPLFLCTGGLIYAKTGDKQKAKAMLSAALKHKPVLPEDVRTESEQALNEM